MATLDRIHALCRILLLGLLLGLRAVGQTSGPQPIRVGSQTNAPPYEFVDERGRPTGYVTEVLRAVGEQQGLLLEFRTGSWDELRTAFDRGELDILAGMVYSEERARTIDFTVPHSTVPYLIVTRRGDHRIRSESDFQGKTILALSRSIISDHLNAQGIPFQGTSSHEAAFRELVAGRGDAAILPKYTYLHFLRSQGVRTLQAVESEVYPTKRCYALRKGNAPLLAKLNEGLFLLKQTGRMDALHQRYFGALEASEVPFKVALGRSLKILIPTVLGLSLIVAFFWSMALRRQVKRRTAHLEAALEQVRQLSGLIPICAHCKKVRDDQGYWQAVEQYISAHSAATFTHGLCPECVHHYFPEVVNRRKP